MNKIKKIAIVMIAAILIPTATAVKAEASPGLELETRIVELERQIELLQQILELTRQIEAVKAQLAAKATQEAITRVEDQTPAIAAAAIEDNEKFEECEKADVIYLKAVEDFNRMMGMAKTTYNLGTICQDATLYCLIEKYDTVGNYCMSNPGECAIRGQLFIDAGTYLSQDKYNDYDIARRKCIHGDAWETKI